MPSNEHASCLDLHTPASQVYDVQEPPIGNLGGTQS